MDSYEAQQRVDALINEMYIIKNPGCVLPRERQNLRDLAEVHAEFIAARDNLARIRANEDEKRNGWVKRKQ